MLTSATLRRVLVALLLAVPLVAAGGTAQAAACSGTSGVTVVVQFPDGHTQTSCTAGNPSTGAAALQGAGFAITWVTGQPFVCKLNAAPSDASCGHTPPADAYWAYFHARRGGAWSYSSEGATSYDPAPGSVEGWRFGNGAKPSTAPPAAAPKPKPKPTPRPTPTTKPSSSASKPAATASASPTAKGTVAAKAARTKAAKAEAARTKAAKAKASKTGVAEAKISATPTSQTPTSQSSAAAAPLDQTGPDTDQGGGNVPWLWGLVGLVVIGGAAGAVTLARRH